MTYIEQAIRDAEKDGYDDSQNYIEDYCHIPERVWLDPAFWQALGKARGWDKQITFYNTFPLKGDSKENNDPWRLYWHRFIDHLIEGKSAEDYFKDL